MKLIGFLFTLAALSCSKSPEVESSFCPGTGKHKAKVIRKGCEAYVFQIIDPTIEVQADWTEIFSKQKYTNVISVMNYCSETADSKALQSLSQGDIITFDLAITKERCLIYCFAFEDAPSKTYMASNIMACDN